jgi:hypothetical protein
MGSGFATAVNIIDEEQRERGSAAFVEPVGSLRV